MFTVYVREVGGREFARYYKKRDNAKNALEKDLGEAVAAGWVVKHKVDKFDAEKGVFELSCSGRTKSGEEFHLYLCDGYFQD